MPDSPGFSYGGAQPSGPSTFGSAGQPLLSNGGGKADFGATATQEFSSLPITDPQILGLGYRNSETNAVIVSQGAATPSVSISDNVWRLPKFRTAIAQMLAGVRNVRVLMIGDSTTRGENPNPVESASSLPGLVASFLPHGSRFSVCGFEAFDTGLIIGSGWVSGRQSLGGLTWQNSTNANPISYTPGKFVDTFDIWYVDSASAGSFTIDLDGGTPQTVTPTGANGYRKATITSGASAATHTLNIKRVSGLAEINLISGYNSAQKEITVVNAGMSGARIATFFSSTTNPWDVANAIAAYAPDLTFIDLTINDIHDTTDMTSFAAQTQAAITAGLASGDVILMTGNPANPMNGGHAPTNVARYVEQYRSLAQANGCTFVNMIDLWVSYANSIANGWLGDTYVHKTLAGEAAQAAYVAYNLQQPWDGPVAALPVAPYTVMVNNSALPAAPVASQKISLGPFPPTTVKSCINEGQFLVDTSDAISGGFGDMTLFKITSTGPANHSYVSFDAMPTLFSSGTTSNYYVGAYIQPAYLNSAWTQYYGGISSPTSFGGATSIGTLTHWAAIDITGPATVSTKEVAFYAANMTKAPPGQNFSLLSDGASVVLDHAGPAVFRSSLNMATAQATLNGTTAGTAVWSQPFQGSSYSKFIVYLNGYENATGTAQTITFPTPFTHTPLIVSQPSAFGATVSTTTLTLPISQASAVTGWIIVEGF